MSKKPLGELAVVALKARNLPDREIVGKQDPFCVFRLGDQAKKTKTDHRGGQHPVWDDQVNLVVPEGKTKMTVQLFDEDKRKEDLISEGEVDLATVIRDGEQDDWFPLQYKGRSAGQIYLELTFYSAAAPSRPSTQPVRYPNHPNQARHAPPDHHGPTAQPHRPPVQQQRPVQQQQQVPPVGPAPYRPPQPQQPPSQMARPHVPPPLNGPPPQASNSAPLYPSNRPAPGGFNVHPQPPPQQQPYPSPQQTRPPGGYQPYPPGQPQTYPSPQPPQPPASYPPASVPQSTSLLTAAFSPQSRPPPNAQRPPPQQYPANPAGGFPGGFSPAPQRPSYPPQGTGGGPPGMAFPEPQHFSNYQPSFDDHGQPFAAHNSPYAPHQQQQQQPQPQPRPMAGYPPAYPPR